MCLGPGRDLIVLANSKTVWCWGSEGIDGMGNHVLLGNGGCGHHSLDSL